MSSVDLAPEEQTLAILGLHQTYAYADDLDLTWSAERLTEATGEPSLHTKGRVEAAQKQEYLGDFVVSLAEWAQEVESVSPMDELCDSRTASELRSTAAAQIESQKDLTTANQLVRALLEAVSDTAWPKTLHWALEPEESLAEAAQRIDPNVSADQVRSLKKSHARAYKRIKKDSAPLLKQAGRAGITATLAGISTGMEDNVAQWIGSTEGGEHLYGAAAESHGLATLGGGSLESGGHGMALGEWVLFGGLHGLETGIRGTATFLGTKLARYEPDAFIGQLAKLDVLQQLDPDLHPTVVETLERVEGEVRTEWDAVRPRSADRRSRMRDHLKSALEDPSKIGEAYEKFRSEIPPKEERSLATAVRALEYELRHLTSPGWKNQVAKAPRWFGVPVASKLLDLVDD